MPSRLRSSATVETSLSHAAHHILVARAFALRRTSITGYTSRGRATCPARAAAGWGRVAGPPRQPAPLPSCHRSGRTGPGPLAARPGPLPRVSGVLVSCSW